MNATLPLAEELSPANAGHAGSNAASLLLAVLPASKVGASSSSRKDAKWQQGSTNVDRASRAVAAAYGCGACMAVVWQASWVEVPAPEDGAEDPAGLAIHTRGRVVHAARDYLPKDPRGREAALSAFDADKRRTVEEFDKATNMRADASNPDMHASRTRRVHAWSNKNFPGVVVIPATRPVRPVLLALADADLDGPLEDWLMIYAAQQMWRWPKVEMYLKAMGHEELESKEAARRLLGVGQSYKDGAKAARERSADFTAKVKAVERLLWKWLERASYVLLEELGGVNADDWQTGDGLMRNIGPGDT